MSFPRWLFSSFPMFLPDSSSHIFFAVFRRDQIPTGSSEEWRQGAFTWAQDTPFYLWLWDHFSTNQAEWKVCAKYTHGGAVKGVVKSNFRFVFRRRRRSLSNRNKILFPAPSTPKAGVGPLFSSLSLQRRMWRQMSKWLLLYVDEPCIVVKPCLWYCIVCTDDDANGVSGIACHLSPFAGIAQPFSWAESSYWTSLKRFLFPHYYKLPQMQLFQVEYFKLAVEFEEEGTGTVVKEETSASLKDKVSEAIRT